MAIIKTLKTIGKTKRGNLQERLKNRTEKILRDNKVPREPYASMDLYSYLIETGFAKKISSYSLKKHIYSEYKKSRQLAKVIIEHTNKMLEQLSKKPELKNAEFVFLDRDALKYMHTAKELCANYGFNREQFKPAIITESARLEINPIFQAIGKEHSEIIDIDSNGKDIIVLSKQIPNTPEIKRMLDKIKQTLNLNKPIIVIDTGLNGTAVKEYQLLLKKINPNIKTYSAMFFATKYAVEELDLFFGEKAGDWNNKSQSHDASKNPSVWDVENIRQFTGKALSSKESDNKNIIIKRANRNKPQGSYSGNYSDPTSAEIFNIALRNQIARYKQKRDI